MRAGFGQCATVEIAVGSYEGYRLPMYLTTGLTVIDLEHLSALERQFVYRALARNVPAKDIAVIIGWGRGDVVDLNSFFIVPKNIPPREYTRMERLGAAWRQFKKAISRNPK